MLCSLKVKLYPSKSQVKVLENHLNAYRYCYNLCLEYKSTLWNHHKVKISKYDMQKELFKIRKETDWLSECKAECLREAAHAVDDSFIKFFNGNKFPRFKNKRSVQSFVAYQAIHCIENRLKFFGNLIKFKTSDKYIAILNRETIRRVTFKKDKCGDYWATCLVELPYVTKLPKVDSVVGIDLGIKELITTSKGVCYENKKLLISKRFKIRKLQRRFSKTKKGGKNREKLRLKIAKIYRKTARQKKHYYHQITNELIRDNQTIVMETLSVKNMIKNRKLSRNISDASWGLITSMLEYKCSWYGRDLIKIDRYFPSSKTCSSCGNIKDNLRLSVRAYICDHCNMEMDRDINAAINIKKVGIKTPELKPVENTDNSLVYEAGINRLNNILN